MELAATLMWRTHYINLTPMYFNKAEGCYKYTLSVLLCGYFFIDSVSILPKSNFITNFTIKPENVFTSMHKCCH